MATRSQVLAYLKQVPAHRNVKHLSLYSSMRCPIHKGGQETHNSLLVNTSTRKAYAIGHWKCLACSARGNIEELIGFFGIKGGQEFIDIEDYDEEYVKTHSNPEDLFPTGSPLTRPWREIDHSILNKMGALLINRTQPIKQLSLFLPVDIGDDRLGAIYANIEKTAKNNYFNTKGTWSSSALFAYNLASDTIIQNNIDTAVLVEGPRDALMLNQQEIPALGILGVSSWSEQKIQLLESLPIERVILAFDADQAGNMATNTIYKALKDRITTEVFEWSEGCDPCSDKQKKRNELKSYL